MQEFWTFIYNLLPEFLSAFLGFGSALLVQRILEKNNQKKSIKNIALELKDIRDQLNIYKDDRSLPPKFAYSINLPVWESIKYNGYLLEFRTKKFYLHLISIYSQLEKLELLENNLSKDYKTLSSQEQMAEINKVIKMRNNIFSILVEEPSITALIDKFGKQD